MSYNYTEMLRMLDFLIILSYLKHKTLLKYVEFKSIKKKIQITFPTFNEKWGFKNKLFNYSYLEDQQFAKDLSSDDVSWEYRFYHYVVITSFIKITASGRSCLGVGIKFRLSANFYTPQNCKCVSGVSWTATQRAVKVGLIASQEIYRESSVFRSFGPRVSSILSSRRDAIRLRISRLDIGVVSKGQPCQKGVRDLPSLHIPDI